MPTLAINWGAWAGAGMAAHAGLERMERLGFGAIKPAQGVTALGYMLLSQGQPDPWTALNRGSVVASVFLWDRMQRSEPVFDELRIVAKAAAGAEEGRDDDVRSGKVATNSATIVTLDSIVRQVNVAVQSIIGANVGPRDPLVAAGLDSLGKEGIV